MKLITRKDFLKKTTAGVIGAGLLSNVTSVVFGAKPKKIKMQYSKLGRTGLKVGILGIGASRTKEPSVIRAAYDSGINFFDSGRAYADGKNEEMIGETLKDVRKKVIYQSKLKVNTEKYTDHASLYKSMEDSMNASLKALQTDYIDTMLLHGVTKLEILKNETVHEFLTKAKESGKIRYVGFSSHKNIPELLEYNNETLFYDVVMVPLNHKGSYVHSVNGKYREWDQVAMIKQLKIAHENNIGVVCMKTTSAGPYTPNENTEESFPNALKWVMAHEFVSTMAVGMGNFEEIKENMSIFSK